MNGRLAILVAMAFWACGAQTPPAPTPPRPAPPLPGTPGGGAGQGGQQTPAPNPQTPGGAGQAPSPAPGQQPPLPNQPVSPAPGQAPPSPVPGQAAPGQTAPGQRTPGQAVPGQTTPGQTAPGQTMPGQPGVAPAGRPPGPGDAVPPTTAPTSRYGGAGPKHTEVRLSLKEAVEWAVQKNLDLVVEDLNRDIAGRQVVIARATFDPFFNVSLTYAKNRDPSASFFEFGLIPLPTVEVSPSDALSFQTAIRGVTPIGTNYQIALGETRSNNPRAGFLAFNPRYSARAFVTASQPLLKNAWPEVNTANIRIAQNNITLSQEQLELVAINTIFAVEQAYWELVFTLKNLDSKRRALEVSTEQLRIDQKKLEVGTKARIDVTTSESQVARRKTEYDQAAALVEDARDRLLDRMNYVGLEESLKGRWERRGSQERFVHYGELMIVPTTEPDPQEVQVDRSDSIRTAFERRREYSQMDLRIRNQDIAIAVAKNQLLPDLSLTAGWTQLGLDQNFGDANNRLLDGDFYDWTVGGFFEIPLSLRGPRANLRNALSVKDQLKVQKQSLENIIVLEVDKAIRDLQFSFQSVQNLAEVVKLQEELLRAERVKLEVGKSIAYTVATIENDLIAAQAQELRAKADYEIAKVSLQRAMGSLLRKWGIELGGR